MLQSKAGGAFRTTPRYNMNQLTRLNFTAADPVQAQLLVASNSVASSYDIIAIQPKTERVLQQVIGFRRDSQPHPSWLPTTPSAFDVAVACAQSASCESPQVWGDIHSTHTRELAWSGLHKVPRQPYLWHIVCGRRMLFSTSCAQ